MEGGRDRGKKEGKISVLGKRGKERIFERLNMKTPFLESKR